MDKNSVFYDQTSDINSFYAKIYSLVGVGIGVSALVAFLTIVAFPEVIISILSGSTMIFYVAIAAELILVYWAHGLAIKNSPAALPVYLLYSTVNGFTLSIILAAYTYSSVVSAFVTSSIMFFVMAIVGRVTKKDLSGMGRACLGALFGIIIASVVNIFLGSGTLDFIISIVGVVIFSGLIAWDNQKIRYVYEQSNGNPGNNWAVSLALHLYLDFINLFLNILRLFGRRN